VDRLLARSREALVHELPLGKAHPPLTQHNTSKASLQQYYHLLRNQELTAIYTTARTYRVI